MNKRQQVRRLKPVPKDCGFCKNNTTPDYKDVSMLQRFVSERAKILAHTKTGICSKHQRRVATAIKYARHLALLPFVQK